MKHDREGRLGWSEVLERGTDPSHVLVVDDEAEVRTSLRRLITSLGHEVKVAASAEEADTWMAAHRFDLALLDIELPRMKGSEFLRWAQERDPELAIIMLTGLDDPDVAVECIDGGARTYLVKPVEFEFLRLAVRDALAMRTLLVERNDQAVPEESP